MRIRAERHLPGSVQQCCELAAASRRTGGIPRSDSIRKGMEVLKYR